MVDFEKTYTRKDLNEIFSHIPPRTIRSWIETGLVEWSEESHDGRGRHRKFKFWNLFQLSLVEQLSGLNLPHDVIKFIMTPSFTGLKDGKANIMGHTGDILVIFKAGLTRQKEVWKCTPVPWKELPKFFGRFSNPSRDDVRIHALKLDLTPSEPIATIMVNMSEVYSRVLAHLGFYG